MFKDLNEVTSSDDWFPYEFIDDKVNIKFNETKGWLAGDEMKKDTKNYVESVNHDPNWLDTINIKLISSWSIVNTLTSSCKYIFNGSKTTFLLHLTEHWSFRVCLVLRKWLRHNYSYILHIKQRLSILCAVISRRLFSFDMLKAKRIFFVSYTC